MKKLQEEKLEEERLEAEKKLEEERLETERAEKEKADAEEKERRANEKIERRLKQDNLKKERLAKSVESARFAAERAEMERFQKGQQAMELQLKKEQQAADEALRLAEEEVTADIEKLAQMREEAERKERLRMERNRMEAEKAEEERLEGVRLAALADEEAKRRAREEFEAEMAAMLAGGSDDEEGETEPESANDHGITVIEELTAPRKLSDDEKAVLWELMRYELNIAAESDHGDAEDLLDYAFDMIESGETIGRITKEVSQSCAFLRSRCAC